MKKAIAIIVSLIFVFALTAVSFAAEKAAKKQITGVVAAVDAKAITVKKGQEEVAAAVNDKTKVMAGEDTKTIADVKVGDKVTVKYTAADGNNVANKIELKDVPAKSAGGY